jgi:hypothetical protein
VTYLNRRALGAALVVAVNSDESSLGRRHRPLTLDDRAVVAALCAVDLVPFDDDTPRDLIAASWTCWPKVATIRRRQPGAAEVLAHAAALSRPCSFERSTASHVRIQAAERNPRYNFGFRTRRTARMLAHDREVDARGLNCPRSCAPRRH